MPNIAHSSGYASNISASQSMQNVNMINPNHSTGAYSQHSIGSSYGHSNQTTPNPTNGSQISAASSHSHMFHPQDMQKQQHIMQQPHQQSNQSTLLRGQNKMPEMTEMLKRRHQRQQEMMPMHSLDGSSVPTAAPHSTSPLSPVKTLPPTAPKPQVNIPREVV